MKKKIRAISFTSCFVFAALSSGFAVSDPIMKYSNQSLDENKGKIVFTEDKPPKNFWGHIYSSEITSFDILPKLVDDDWRNLTYEERQKVFAEYQEGMSRMPSVSEYDESEGNLIRLIGKAYPGMASYWVDAIYFNDVRIIQSDKIIDLARVHIKPFEMGAKQTENGFFYSTDEADHATPVTAENSHERMKKGLAPIGPDGLPILLCRLNDDPRGSYFEVTHREAVRLLNALSSGMSLERACLTDEIFGDYWKSRLKALN